MKGRTKRPMFALPVSELGLAEDQQQKISDQLPGSGSPAEGKGKGGGLTPGRALQLGGGGFPEPQLVSKELGIQRKPVVQCLRLR